MIRALEAAGRRLADAVAAIAADGEDELRHMGEADQRWIVAGGVVAVALIAVLLGLN